MISDRLFSIVNRVLQNIHLRVLFYIGISFFPDRLFYELVLLEPEHLLNQQTGGQFGQRWPTVVNVTDTKQFQRG